MGPEEQAMGKVSVLKDLNFCNRHEGTDRSVVSFGRWSVGAGTDWVVVVVVSDRSC